VAVKGGVDDCGECEGFDGFVAKVGRDGLPVTSVAAFHDVEELCRCCVGHV
jgi:hypothetical protein